jgi:hypothetical protein
VKVYRYVSHLLHILRLCNQYYYRVVPSNTTTTTQEFGPRCAPSLFAITLNELQHGLYTCRRLYSQEENRACRLKRKCYLHPNSHACGVDGWTATTVHNNQGRGRVVNSVRIHIYRHARFWQSTSICRLEIMSEDAIVSPSAPMLKQSIPVTFPSTSSDTAVATLMSIRSVR